jgi:hypothetical protein
LAAIRDAPTLICATLKCEIEHANIANWSSDNALLDFDEFAVARNSTMAKVADKFSCAGKLEVLNQRLENCNC